MKVTLEREGKNVIKLGIELEAERVKRAYEMACRQLSNQVRIPGFRPGKAPRMILEKTQAMRTVWDRPGLLAGSDC